MATLSTNARNTSCDAVTALLNAGSGANPQLIIRTAAQATLCTINLDGTDAVGDAVAGVATVAPPAGEGSWVGYQINPSADGVAADAIVVDKDAATVYELTVGVTAGPGVDLQLATLTLQTAVPITFSAAPTITQLAAPA
jgi:hypothetical protein